MSDKHKQEKPEKVEDEEDVQSPATTDPIVPDPGETSGPPEPKPEGGDGE